MEKLHNLLKSWAIDEMRFQITAYGSSSVASLPEEEDFKRLCKKPLCDVWKYVVKHIKSKQTVKDIKGNIELQKLGGQKPFKDQAKPRKPEGEKSLQQEKDELARELALCESDLSHLHSEMNHTTREVMDAELTYQSIQHRVRDMQRKQSILDVASRCAEEKVAKYEEYDHRVAKRIQSLTGKSESTGNNYVSRNTRNKSEDLETVCCRDVRITCEAIEEFLQRIVDGSLADKNSLENAQMQLWEKVEETTSPHSVTSLVSALITNTESAVKDLREKTLQVNINEDAESLSFSYDNRSGLHDQLSQPSVQKSVQDLLLVGNEQHVMCWFKAQEHQNEEWKLLARLDDLITDIYKQLQKVVGEHPRSLHLAKGYIDAKIQLAEERSVLPCLKAEADSLMARIQKAKQERDELRLKFEKIQDFRANVEKKQNIVSTLAKQNAGAPSRLDSQRKEVMNYIMSRSMNTHATEIRHLTGDLKNTLISEVMKFSSVGLPCLVTVQMDSTTRQCVLDLSIGPSVHPVVHEKLHMFRDVSAALGFPDYKSIDSLFRHVLHIHGHIQDLRLSEKRREDGINTAVTSADASDDINTYVEKVKVNTAELCQKAEQHDRAQCEKLLPKLQKRLETVAAHTARMSDVRKQISDWWECPAQSLTPWVLTEGLTFEQWMQKWRVAVTQLHKKMSGSTTPVTPRTPRKV